MVADATSQKTPQTVLISNIRGLLELYKENHDNNLPKNWPEFIDSGVFTDQLLNDARRILDIENRYAFVDMKPIELSSGMVRIIIMAKQPGAEGDRVDTRELEKKKGRWLIMEASDGSIQIGKVPEVMLDYWFKKAGLDLANYTFPAPPLPVFPPLPKSNSEGLILGGP